ncbi:hypothetical protein EV361DRAFT_180950 [Lentinula raphanica]|nr:hypothetical protein EV360DRAFT_55988 [Lentinula raphanica]KAJ3963527.1 hypothetical protein EV361DRAFT_180950 [Lentinula raphanica]
MLGVCRERGDQSGVDFWAYGLNVTEVLGDNGMSDEEDDAREVEVEGVKVKQNVKVILQSYWRHPDLNDLFKLMDQAPVLEKLIFHRAGAGRIPRIRSNKLSHRSPPTDLPREFFREEFLAPLFPHEVMELKLAEYTFQRVNFGGYTPTASANEGSSQTNSMQVD